MRSIYNPEVYPKLAPVIPSRTWAALCNDRDPSIVYHYFLMNPQTIEWNREANYDEAAIPLTEVPAQQYKNTTGKRVSIPDLFLDGGGNKSIESQLTSLEALLLQNKDTRQPKPLCFAWGSRFIKPLVLTSLRVTERVWAGGVCTSATVAIDLLEIPPDRSAPANAKDTKFKAGNSARQKAEAQAAAKAWVKNNPTKLPAKAKGKAQAQKVAYTVNDDGLVSMVDADDNTKLLGNLGKWTGRELDTSTQKWTA
jgi:hypothetical protein